MTATGVDGGSLEIDSPTLGTAERRNFRVYACAVFVLAGVITTMLGPLLPLLSTQWHLSLAQAGSLFTWQFGGATLGTLLTAIFRKRVRFHVVVITGLSLCVLGVAGLAVLAWPLLPWGIACYGFGLGVLIPIINVAIAHSAHLRAASTLSIVNLCWTSGAVVGPLLLEGVGSPTRFLYGIAAAAVAFLLVSFFVTFPSVHQQHPVPAQTAPAHASRAALMFGALFFLYVGTENAISGWLTFYAAPAFHSSYRAMTVTSIFWLAFMSGRAIAAAVLTRISDSIVVGCGLSAGLLGVVCLAYSSAAFGLFTSVVLIGLALAPVYPILIARLVRRVGAASPIAVGSFACSGLGAALLPLASGWTSEYAGRVSAGLAVPAAALAVLLIAAFTSLRAENKPLSSDLHTEQ